MRIAVCRPQVPFARGGAEIFTDALVEELRARAPCRPRLGAVQVVSGRACAHPGVPLEDARPRRRRTAAGSTWSSRRSFPRTSCGMRRSASGSSHQFLAGLRARRHAARTVRRLARGPGAATQGAAARPHRARRGHPTLHDVAQRGQRGSRHRRVWAAEVLPHPPQELAYRCAGHENFILSVNRLDRSKRIDLLIEAAARDSGLEVVITGEGPDRDRLESLARERGLNGRARFTGASPKPTLRTLMRAASPSTTRLSTRTTGWFRSRRFSRRSRCSRLTDAGGTARGRLRSCDRARRRAGCGRGREGARLVARAPRRGGGVRPCRKRHRARGDGDRAIERLLA